MTQTSFYGDTPNFATDYPTQNDGAPTTGNTPAPSSFYPNGGGYVPLAIADDVLAEAQALAAQADTDAANAATSATNAATSAANAAAAVQAAAGTATPIVNGTAAVGTGTKWAHEDHVHPTDTSRADAAATTSALALKAPLASPALTGTPTAPTATAGTNTTQLATTAFTGAAVAAEAALRASADALLAPLASPALTGVPTAPTPTAGDNSAKIATTAFVSGAAAPNNKIINSAMMVSQENGAVAGTVTGYFPVDQWTLSTTSAGVCSVGQVASITPGGSPNRLRVTVTTADASVGATDRVAIGQTIEGLRVADLRSGLASAKTITVQFGVKGPAGTYCVSIRNGATTRSYIAEFTITAGEANTDVVKSVTIALDQTGTWATDNTAGLYLFVSLMAGSTFQTPANTWTAGNFTGTSNQFNFMATVGNVFELFDVGLYAGTTAPTFQVPDFASELLLCARYWEKSYNYAVAPGTATYSGAETSGGNGYASTTSVVRTSVYKVKKRATPTVVTYSTNTGTSGKVFDAANSADLTPTVDNIGEAAFRVVVTQTANPVTAMYHQWTANARM